MVECDFSMSGNPGSIPSTLHPPPKQVYGEDTVGKLKNKMATHIMGNKFVNHVFDRALIPTT